MEFRFFIMLIVLCTVSIACKKENPVFPSVSRSYRMGFQNSAPRFDDINLFLQSLQIWTPKADAAIITTEVPWDSIYSGKPIEKYVINNYKALVDFYRSKNLKLWVYIDPQNGLNRASDARELVTRGKSIAQAEVQNNYRRFVIVMDSILKPDHVGLALETNLIRAASSVDIYNGVKKAANEAAIELRKKNPSVKLSISIQVDYAWGRLLGNGTYVGIEQDFIDFPFIEELGLSSYPYFDFSKPEDIPLDYYTRLKEGKSIPVFVTEGGWPSQSFNGPGQKMISSNVKLQQSYLNRQSQLLDKAQATAVFQLTFTDIDLTSLPSFVDPNISNFAYLGLVDIQLKSKPGFDTWANIFGRTLKE